MKALYIDKNGVVRYMPDCPEEPTLIEAAGLPRGRSRFKLRFEYEQALAAAKESAIEFVDQLQVKQIIFERFCIFPKEYQDRHDTIYPFPYDQYEVEVMYRQPCSRCPRYCYNFQMGDCKNTYAFITPKQKEESQEDLIDDLISYTFGANVEGREKIRQLFTITRKTILPMPGK